MGFEIHCAASLKDRSPLLDELPITLHEISISRNPLAFENYKGFKELCEIIDEHGIQYVHCHSPTGGMIGRLAAKACKVKKIMYTAHGFHFFKGSPLKNWLLYYPVEFLLSKITDALFTINLEDFNLAREKMLAKHVYFVEGIGVDLDKFKSIAIDTNDGAYTAFDDSRINLITIGEFIDRKNYSTLLHSVAKLEKEKFRLFICGIGERENQIRLLAQSLGLENNVVFLGYRKDIPQLLKRCDIFVFTSFQEGLPVSVMEAMACGLPVVCSDIRGNSDLIDDALGGFTCNPHNSDEFYNRLKLLCNNEEERKRLGQYNLEKIKKYSSQELSKKMKSYYSEIMNSNDE